MKSLRIATLFLLPALVALAQQPRRPPAAWLDPDRTEPSGTRYGAFTSKLAGGEVSYLLYLPPEYQTATDRRFPVAYWLHGLGANQRVGATHFVAQLDMAIRNGKAPAMIVVLVNGMRDSFYNDPPDGKWPIESVIVKELAPHVDQTYRTMARRETRAVEGFSMGGYGAAHLGFKYPDLFGIVGIMAGALIDFSNSQADIFQKMYGGDKAYVMANDPAALVRKNAEAIRGKTAVRIAVGDQDRLQIRSQALHELLVQLKIEHQYEMVPGVGHSAALFYSTLGARAFGYYEKALNHPARKENAFAPPRQFEPKPDWRF